MTARSQERAMEERAASREADRELLEAVLKGDGTAYRGLVEKYQGRVYAMVYGMLRNREDARDVTQEAFVKAYRNLESFRLESSFYTWIYRIAMNLAIDFTRKRKRRETSGFDENIAARDEDGDIAEAHHEDGPGRQLERKQLFARIMTAMQQLPEDQRQVILLRELEGLQYKEIAEIMEIPEGTVMSRLFYARKKLQKLLSGDHTPSTADDRA
ncbi:MAG: sigma-70 family RNA polymerase sigma factor [Alphaproteobacteria bacterium]|nr:sigma-70 family RNA polymerase sigma factor [Alphaproteobacteria bacterium]MCB9696564.1 sigma-70 family RNA polymerase sigma factor [Alphaproteobacteria bacterium]